MNFKQIINYVVIPTLDKLGLNSSTAVRLISGTIAQESNGKYIRQLRNGPALGICQMEPATFVDICDNYLAFRPHLIHKLRASCIVPIKDNTLPPPDAMVANMAFSVAMCRYHYLRVKHPLPDANDIGQIALYWKKYYNTAEGAGTVKEFRYNYEKYCSAYFGK